MTEKNAEQPVLEQTHEPVDLSEPAWIADATSFADAETQEWTREVALLSDSGGLEDWRKFSDSRETAVKATLDQLPKLTLLDYGRESVTALDSQTIAARKGDKPTSPIAVDTNTPGSPKVTEGDKGVSPDPAVRSVAEFEDGQAIPGEPPRITDPLPAIPPGMRVTIPNPNLPGFSIMDPARPETPGVIADPSTPVKAGVSADPIRPLEPVVGSGTRDIDKEVNDGLSVPTEPPRLTDPLPKIPPAIQRIVDHGTLTGRKSDSSGASIRHPNTKDTTPAGQAVAAFRANLRAADAQNQAGQNPKLVAQLAAQMELKKLATLNTERAIKETATTAAALLARKALMRREQGSEKNSAVKPGGSPKELGNRDPLQIPDGLAVEPALEHEKTDLRAVLHTDFAALILPAKGKHGVASSLPVDSPPLHRAKGKELVAATKLLDAKGTAGTGHLLEQADAGKTHLPGLTLVEKPYAIEPHSIEPPAVKIAESNDSFISKPAKQNPPAFDFTAPTLSQRGKLFLAANTHIQRSLLREGSASELIAVHTPVERSHMRGGSGAELVLAHTPTPRSLLREGSASELIAAHTPAERSQLRRAAGAEIAALNMPISSSLMGAAAGREFVVANIPQNIKVISRARHAIGPSFATARPGEPTVANTFKATARPLNFSPVPDDGNKLLVAEKPTNGSSFLRIATGEKVFVAAAALPVKALRGQANQSLHANSENPQPAERITDLLPLKPHTHTPLAYARILGEKNSTTLGVEKQHSREMGESADKKADKIARSLSNGIKTFTLPLPVGEGGTSSTLASKIGSTATAHARKSIATAHARSSIATAHARSSIATAHERSSIATAHERSSIATALRQYSTAHASSAIAMISTDSSGSPQKDVSEIQIAGIEASGDRADINSTKLAGDLKLRVTYLHIGNRIFLLERRLVDKNSPAKQPAAPSGELVVAAGVAGLIGGRWLRRRGKKGEAPDDTNAAINEFGEGESLPTDDNVQLNRECVPPALAVTRFGYMIQPGDTLSNLAKAIWQDSEVAWLVAEVNKLKHEWQGSECSITLVERQVIELPLPEEIVDFYRSGGSTLHKQHKLTTNVRRCKLDEELSAAPLPMRFNAPGQMIQPLH